MKKYITFVVPCYNSQDYMERCIDSLIVGEDNVEIIIVNDGSTDSTGDIADRYQAIFPDIVKVIHKKNGGHGSGVNVGLENAHGLYFKVVDSDDWLGENEYMKLLSNIGELVNAVEKHKQREFPDLIVTNYEYDHLDKKKDRIIDYKNVFPVNEMCTWDEIGHFMPKQYLIMHALFFKTEILKKSDVKLPENTFYVDNLFAYKPLPLVENIYYMDLNVYHYYLGREDQSVNENVLMKRIDQQIEVTKLVALSVDLDQVKSQKPKLASYMYRNISIMMAISSIHLLLINTKESISKRNELWHFIKTKNKKMYYKLRLKTISTFTYMPGKVGRKVTVLGYKLAKKIYQFQ